MLRNISKKSRFLRNYIVVGRLLMGGEIVGLPMTPLFDVVRNLRGRRKNSMKRGTFNEERERQQRVGRVPS